MITIIIYGLDPFVVCDISKNYSKNVAKIYEVDEDQVTFIGPENNVFHKGIEQTSWDVHIFVSAPKKVSVLQEQVSKVILASLKNIAIHVTIIFNYYLSEERVVYIDKDYPRYITEENTVNINTDEDDEKEINYEVGDGDNQIYTGNIFKDFNKNK